MYTASITSVMLASIIIARSMAMCKAVCAGRVRIYECSYTLHELMANIRVYIHELHALWKRGGWQFDSDKTYILGGRWPRMRGHRNGLDHSHPCLTVQNRHIQAIACHVDPLIPMTSLAYASIWTCCLFVASRVTTVGRMACKQRTTPVVVLQFCDFGRVALLLYRECQASVIFK